MLDSTAIVEFVHRHWMQYFDHWCSEQIRIFSQNTSFLKQVTFVSHLFTICMCLFIAAVHLCIFEACVYDLNIGLAAMARTEQLHLKTVIYFPLYWIEVKYFKKNHWIHWVPLARSYMYELDATPYSGSQIYVLVYQTSVCWFNITFVEIVTACIQTFLRNNIHILWKWNLKRNPEVRLNFDIFIHLCVVETQSLRWVCYITER